MSGRVVLVLGGARGGKSAWAEELAARSGRSVVYVATATAGDTEMAERIDTHRAARPSTWRTVEAPLEPGDAVRTHARSGEVVLLDCLTLWVSNVILRWTEDAPNIEAVPSDQWAAVETHLLGAIEELVDRARAVGAGLILVSNEVGMGLVPPSLLGRRYRDILGRVNQVAASRADSVVLIIAGLPVDLRRLVTPEPQAIFDATDPNEESGCGCGADPRRGGAATPAIREEG